MTQTSHPVQIFKQTNSTSCWTESKSDITIFMDIQIFKYIHNSRDMPDLGWYSQRDVRVKKARSHADLVVREILIFSKHFSRESDTHVHVY